MLRVGNLLLGLVIGLCVWVASCGNPLEEANAREEQRYQDSLNQAILDTQIIDDYIEKKGYDSFDISVTDDGLKYFVYDEGAGTRYPKFNEIISIDYVALFSDDEILDTSVKSIALSADSLSLVNMGVNVVDTMSVGNRTLEEALNYIAGNYGTLTSPVHSSSRVYSPITYNHTPDGFGLGTSFISGFTEGTHLLVPELSIGGSGYIFIPSVLAYGQTGIPDNAGGYVVDPNTVVIYELRLAAIRP